jgi:pimeloyl-ACP methyl ester carboxylesterase
MAHVTFIHGLANKPEADSLHAIWRRTLAKGDDGLDLNDEGVTTSFVYWADVLYPEPDANVADYESVSEHLAEAVDGGGNAEMPVGTTDEERRVIAGLRAGMTGLSDAEIEAASRSHDAAGTASLERVPLPWFIKKRIMAAHIRDAYLYLFDKEFSPRPGVTFNVRTELRGRFIAALNAAPADGPHVVVSHSMGTMIAYDCLKRVAGCPRVDGLMTLGSPLGVDELQDCFKPEWSRDNGYPDPAIVPRWINVFDPFDVVCGADPRLANDYRLAGAGRITDLAVTNDGAWRHSIAKYFARPQVRSALRQLLGLTA